MIIKRRIEWSRSIMTAALAALLVVVGLAPAVYSQQRRRPAPVRLSVYGQGYQKGYADGFAQGMRDWTRGVPRDWQRSEGYERRENSYSPRLSSSQEYTQGYQLGFEMGHTDGYYGRPRNAAVPTNALVLAKAAALADAQRAREQEPNRDYPRDGERSRRVAASPDVPEDTELRIQLTTPLDTKTNRVGDTFSARVIMPSAYEGATVDGHIANINRSGRVSGKTELALDFDTITLPDGRRAPLKADLVRVIESESVKKVDEEGQVESGSRTKDSTVRGGVGATAGAIIGGIAGGAKGAILGAIIGGAAGVGTVYVEGNKDLILDRGTEMVIRTAGRSRR